MRVFLTLIAVLAVATTAQAAFAYKTSERVDNATATRYCYYKHPDGRTITRKLALHQICPATIEV